MGPAAMVSVFWMLSFRPTFSLSSFTFIKRLFNSLLSALRVMSSAYLRLLIFLPALLIPACVSSTLAFYMMYSAHKLNKQGDYIQPWHTPYPILNQSMVPCPVLTVALWPVSFPSDTPPIQMLLCVTLSHTWYFLDCHLFFFILFPLFSFVSVISDTRLFCLPAHLPILLPQLFCYWLFLVFFFFHFSYYIVNLSLLVL